MPGEVSAGPYQTRVIVRDVTGKYTWDSTLLYGLDTVLDGECDISHLVRGGMWQCSYKLVRGP